MNEQDGFQRRLDAARAQQDAATRKAFPTEAPASPWGIGFRAGIEVVAALGVGVAVGLLLDRWLGTFPLLFLLFFVAGGAAGILNIFRLFNPRRPPG